MVTVGMNYEVLEGKEEAFEKKFALVVNALETTSGHVSTRLYKQVVNPRSYLVVSEWVTRAAFDAFIGSEAFRKTTSWGTGGILASRPQHRIYGSSDDLGRGCPAGRVDASTNAMSAT